MFRQSKQESNSTDQLAITMNTSQHNKIYNYHNMAAFPRQKSRLRGLSLEAGSLLSRAGSCNANWGSAILNSCKDSPAHQNREDNVNKNVKSKPFPFPGNGAKNLIGAEPALKKCVFMKSMKKLVYVLMFPRYFRYSIGSTGRIHRDRRR